MRELRVMKADPLLSNCRKLEAELLECFTLCGIQIMM